MSQAPASAYLDHGGSACAPETFPVRLASYDPEVSADDNIKDMRVATMCMLAVLALLLSILPVRADTVESSTNLTEWAASSTPWDQVLEMVRTNSATAGNPSAYYYRLVTTTKPLPDGFHAARQTIPPPPPVKERVTIGDPFFPIPSRKLAWDYDANFVGTFEIYWASNPSDLVQVGETTNRVWTINNPARRGWFGVRARDPNGNVSVWATVPNLK